MAKMTQARSICHISFVISHWWIQVWQRPRENMFLRMILELRLASTPKALNNLAQGNTLGKKQTSRFYPERVEYVIAGGSSILPLQGDES